ncbi:MAG: 30S ribosomal protein S3 [Chlamydiia bacterium]|nr:30S ribosomal protein S3 [Chlamydiia bacterium]
MGQKTNPNGFRLAVRKKWKSSWYASKKMFADYLLEDQKIRKFLRDKPSCQSAKEFTIKRTGDKIEVTIHTPRPGLVIGKKGMEIESLKAALKKFVGKEVWVEVEEIKRPDLDAKLVAESIGQQLKRRAAFRRALKKAMQNAMDAGALGIKVQCSGRLGGAEIARTEWYKEGKIPMQTLRYDLDYASVRSETTYGTIGIKVWITRKEMAKETAGK